MQIQEIALGELVPTADNPRMFPKNDPKLAELADSIKAHGVLSPVLARPLNGHFDLRAGERRWRAAKLAGLATIPCIVREMSDREAVEITVTENLQREDLHPLEEAKGIQALLDNGWTLEQAAAQLGKSTRFIARRAQLANLSELWRRAIQDALSVVSHWPAIHLELIARLPHAVQDDVLETFDERDANLSAAQLRHVLAHRLHFLEHAPWKKDDETLDVAAGACTACLKRSDRQPELFDDEDLNETKTRCAGVACLDEQCWNRKLAAYVVQRDAELRSKHEAVVHLQEGSMAVRRNPWADTTVPSWEVTPCKKGDPGARMALYISGARAGQSQWVTVSAGSGRGGRIGQPEKSLVDRKQQMKKLRTRIVMEAVVKQLEARIGNNGVLPQRSEAECLAFVLAFGTVQRKDTVFYGDPWHELDTLKRTLDLMGIMHELVRSATAVLVRRLRSGFYNPRLDDAQRACEFFGFDAKAMWAEAVKQKPDPKSWAKLEAEEKAKETVKPKTKSRTVRTGQTSRSKKRAPQVDDGNEDSKSEG